jgi:hypothetical protein
MVTLLQYSETKHVKSKAVKHDHEIENIYFSLDLRIPKYFSACKPEVRSFDKITQTPNKFSKSLPKFRLTECLKIFKLELESQNPWLNKEFNNLYTKKKPKRVRIRILEIESSVYELPYCRRNNPILIPESGRLHAPHCKNTNQETVDVIGDRTFQNRQFHLLDIKQRISQLQAASTPEC